MSGFSGGSFSFSRSHSASGFGGHSHSRKKKYGHRGHVRQAAVRRGGCMGAFVVGAVVLGGAVTAVGGLISLLV